MRSSQPERAPVTAGAPGAATSSVQKACRILRTLGDPRNGRLTEIAASAGLDKATTVRLLEALAGDGKIASVDLNPVMVGAVGEGALVVDALVERG